jgi:hypothetical protein
MKLRCQWFALPIVIVIVDVGLSFASPTITETVKLLTNDGNEPDQFGRSISIDGNLALISAYADNGGRGSVYAFERGPGGSWQQVNKFTAGDLKTSALFGNSLALCGNNAVVGAYQQDLPDLGAPKGAAYIFTSNTNGQWSQVRRLDPLEPTQYFGTSTGLWGGTAIVGTPWNDTPGISQSGVAYVFTEQQQWNRTQRLIPTDVQAGDHFGKSVSLDGSRALISSVYDDDNGVNSGSAYIFEDRGSAGWQQVAKLKASDGIAGDTFGQSVSLWGDFALISAQGLGARSAAYLFHHDEAGDWRQIAKLTPSVAQTSNSFGTSVAIHGDLAVVGAPDRNSGTAFLFRFDAAGYWAEIGQLMPSDGAANETFGWPVALSDNEVFVANQADGDRGRIAGATYVYSAPQTVAGDLNSDGNVDAADYIVWRKTGETAAGYDTWRAQFGQTPAGGSALTSAEPPMSAAIPEPATLIMLIVGVLAIHFRRLRLVS